MNWLRKYFQHRRMLAGVRKLGALIDKLNAESEYGTITMSNHFGEVITGSAQTEVVLKCDNQ